ncbi:MAG TPA: pyruvate kinase [Bacteroidota bacterium]|nr:pyruvate kinase [Bacteroidota bacterium]
MAPKNQPFARTKIVCTLGPASDTVETIRPLVESGMDVARLNFSHGTHDDHRRVLLNLRRVAEALNEPITVIQDLQGPKIRIGSLATDTVELKENSTVIISTNDRKGTAEILSTTYQDLVKDVKPGDRVLLDDGKLELRVLHVITQTDIELRVISGGTLTAHKGINLPGVAISAPSLTEKDKADLQFAFEEDIDYVALSFVRRAHDIAILRDFIIENGPKGRKIPIIAKIEKGEAVDDIDGILKETDAVMVARGDLGVEVPAEDVPLLQKMIVRKCNEIGKPVIIATQMLETMIENPTPTRAEASDVANAVLDGADAVMLSGETSVGHHPIQAVQVMDRIIRKTEEQTQRYENYDPRWIPLTHEYDPLTRSACVLADTLKASTIVVLTHSGSTATRVAKFRPPARIIAVTDRDKIMRRLNLVWGLRGLIVENLKKDSDATFKKIQEQLLQEGYIEHGETIVMLAGIPLFEGHPTNTIKVDTV